MSSRTIRRFTTAAYLVLFYTYLFLPLLFMGIVAFNHSSIPQVTPWEGFTLKWFHQLYTDEQLWLIAQYFAAQQTSGSSDD